MNISPLHSCIRRLPSIKQTGRARSLCACGVEDHAHVIMLAREKAAVEWCGAVDILVDEIRSYSVLMSSDFAMSRKISEADFENSFKGLTISQCETHRRFMTNLPRVNGLQVKPVASAQSIFEHGGLLCPSSVQLGWNTGLQRDYFIVGHGIDSPMNLFDWPYVHSGICKATTVWTHHILCK